MPPTRRPWRGCGARRRGAVPPGGPTGGAGARAEARAGGAALARLGAATRVVVSTVGPSPLYGCPLVKVCAETGTDYCDLTGEVQWIRRMIRKYEGAARASGARIVHCCGFDSLPSDLGVHFLQKHAMQKYGRTCPRVKLRVKAMRGGASGGTIASMLNVVKEASDDP